VSDEELLRRFAEGSLTPESLALFRVRLCLNPALVEAAWEKEHRRVFMRKAEQEQK
jgi:hypothetical protein